MPDVVAEAVAILRRGGLVAFPTETVYGLGADASNDAAVARVFAAKGRPADHPLIVHLAPEARLEDWADEVAAGAHVLARAFWPGPLTLILPRHQLPALAATGGQPSIGLRVPAHPLALAVLRGFGGGIAAPSANRFGRVSPTRAEHVRSELGPSVDLILDGGACAVGVESTIVDFTSGAPRLLRPGGVTAEAIEAALGSPLSLAGSDAPRAPGALPSHYAPRARVVVTAEREGFERALAQAERQGLRASGLWCGPALLLASACPIHQLGDDLALAAHNLYAKLRELDEQGAELIVARLPEDRGLGAAIADRLRKAAGPR